MSIENNIERILSVVEEIKERLQKIEGVSVSVPIVAEKKVPTPPPVAEKKVPTPPPVAEKKVPTPPPVADLPETFNELSTVLSNIMKSYSTLGGPTVQKTVMGVISNYDPAMIDGTKTAPYLSRVPKESWDALIQDVSNTLQEMSQQ